MPRKDLNSFLFRFHRREEQLLLALAIHENVASAVTARDLFWWLQEGASHPNLDCRWKSERDVLAGLRTLRRERLINGSINAAIHETSLTWSLRDAGWRRLAERVLFLPGRRNAA